MNAIKNVGRISRGFITITTASIVLLRSFGTDARYTLQKGFSLLSCDCHEGNIRNAPAKRAF